MQKLKSYHPLYQPYQCRRMSAALIKPVARWRKRIGMIAAISLAGLLSGCLHSSASVIPQDGPTMQVIYTQASRSSIMKADKSPTLSTQHKPVAQALPKMTPLIVFAHPVQAGQNRIIIPTYTAYFQALI